MILLSFTIEPRSIFPFTFNKALWLHQPHFLSPAYFANQRSNTILWFLYQDNIFGTSDDKQIVMDIANLNWNSNTHSR